MVRELFVMAREHAPSIIFMDEIDSIGSSRGESGSGGGDSEVQRTMLELLNQLDGFESTKNIKVCENIPSLPTRLILCFTGHHGYESNRHPGFCTVATGSYRPKDRVPTSRSRSTSCYSPYSLSQDVPSAWYQSTRYDLLILFCLDYANFGIGMLAALAEKTGQCSGAEVRGICQEAGMYALRERRQHVTQDDFEMAVSKVLKKHNDGNTSTTKLFT